MRAAARLTALASAAAREPSVPFTMVWLRAGLHGGNLLHLAAVQVAPQTPAPVDMAPPDVPAGDYAVFEFPFGDVGQAYPFIFGTWLPGSGHVQDARALLERYGTDFCPDRPASPMQVRVPVRPRA